MRAVSLFLGAVLILSVAILGARWQWHRLMADPEVAFLQSHPNAEWIRMPELEGPKTHGKRDFMAAFRTKFTIEQRIEEADLIVYAFRYGVVYLDGVAVSIGSQDHSEWKTPHFIKIRPATPGEHELAISVINRTGPPVVFAYSPQLGIHSGPDWQVKNHERTEWINAVSVDAPQANDIGEKLPPVHTAFARTLPVTAPVFVLVFLIAFFYDRLPRAILRWSTADVAQWGLLIAWGVLCLNNVLKVPYGLGFDVDAHVQYFQFLLRKHTIPYADQGWQMFQSPLYYMIAAPLYAVFSELSPTHGALVVRVISIFCGGIQIHLCCLAVREFFPDDKGAQVLATLLGGFLPINVYQSQNLGNEPLMALFSSLVLLRLFLVMRDPQRHCGPRSFAITGLLLGAALLTKATALLLFPPAGLAILIAAAREHPSFRARIRFVLGGSATLFGVAAVVSAWYYIRNYFRFGRFFVGGWEELRGYIWWQEPGYRTARQFYTFGESLVYPLYSAVHGFWDGLYSTFWLPGFHQPPDAKMASYPGWNYDFVLSSAWWSLLPSAILLIGIARILWRPVRSIRSGEILSVACLAIFVAAMAYLTLRLPSFSTIKATYLLALVTCVSIVAARGFQPMLAHRAPRALAYAGMASWAVTVFAAHFVT